MTSTEQISFQLYKWLSSLQIITSNQKYKSSGNIQIDSKIRDELISGHTITKIVEQIAADMKVQLNGPLLSSVKKSNTPAARLYNWNILSESFSKVGISLSKEIQKEITTGNFQALKRFLIQVHKKSIPSKKAQKNAATLQESQDVKVDFKKIEGYKDIQQTETVVEAILVAIKTTCGLTLKQAYSTLGENVKYLAHMIVKGIKNSYEEIQNFLMALVNYMHHIMFLCQKDPARNNQFLLEIIKPSLISRDSKVAQIGCLAFKALVYESLKYNQKNLIYQLLSQEHLGFDFIYMGIKRHPHLTRDYNSFLHPLINTVYKQFYELHMKNIINNDQQYLKTIIILLEGVASEQQSKKAIIQSGLLKIWVKYCQDTFNTKSKRDYIPISEQTKVLSLELLLDLWKAYSSQMDQLQAEELLMKGIDQLKRNTRKDNYVIKISALNRLFDFFDYLASNKNRLASILYKKMIFLFVQNHEQNETRQTILQNFMLILRKFPTIPLQFLLQPLLRQLTTTQGKSYILNIYDFEFFIQIFKHPRMQAAYALNFLEYFSRLYTKNIIYSGLVIRIIQLLSSRYCEQEAIMEYIMKNVDSNLNSYGMLVLGKKKYNNNRDQLIMNNQKKSLIIELIKHYVKLENQLINDSIKDKILNLYVVWMDGKGVQDKGLYSILTLFGDVEQMTMQERVQKQSKRNRRQQDSAMSHNHKYNNNQSSVQRNPISHENEGSYSRVKPVGKNDSFADMKPKSRLVYDEFQDDDFFTRNFNHNSDSRKKDQHHRMQSDQLSQLIDPKTLQDIQLYKVKYKKQAQRKKQLYEKQQQTYEPLKKVNTTQLIQRQLSLGYTKLPGLKELTSQNMMFEFDSVKKKHLKDQTQIIELEIEEERDLQSTEKILSRYQKHIKSLFFQYTAQGNAANRSNSKKIVLSFTDLMRMLKQKNLNKLPKIIINQLIIHINRKKKYNSNVLAGVQQSQFNEFLILFTNLFIKSQNYSKDEPFGNKVQLVLFKLFENQSFAKDINDKKAQKWIEDNQILKQSQEDQQKVQIPEGYRKIVNQELVSNYKIKGEEFNLFESYQDCFEVLNELLSKALGIHIFPAISQVKKITRIVPISKLAKAKIPASMTQKYIKKTIQNGDDTLTQNQVVLPTKKLKKSPNFNKSSLNNNVKVNRSASYNAFKKSRNDLKLNDLSEDQIKKKQKTHEMQEKRAKKLKSDLIVLDQKKKKRLQEEKKIKQQQQKIKLKKQEAHKKYLQQNRKRLEKKKQEEQKEKKQKQQKQKQQKQIKKAKAKQKEKQLLDRQKQLLKQKKQKFSQKNKSLERKIQKRQNLQKKALKAIDNMDHQDVEKQRRLMDTLNKEDSSFMKVVNNYEIQVKHLFQEYWNWKTKKMQLKNVVLLLKNFKISPQYLPPKVISENYKTISKGQALDLEKFKKLLIKYSFKSEKLLQQHQPIGQLEFNPSVPQYFLAEKLKMKEFNYQHVVKQAKYNQI